MSTVKVTTFAAFHRQADPIKPKILFGASEARKRDDGGVELVVDNLPIAANRKAPGGGLLMAYGFKDALEEIQTRRAQARTANAEFRFCEIEVDVGYIEPGIVDRDMLRNARFVNMRRLSAPLQQEILDIFNEYIRMDQEEARTVNPGAFLGSGEQKLASLNRVKEIGSRPDLFERLLDQDDDYKNLECFIIPITEGDKIRTVAYLRNNFKYVGTSQSRDSETLALPDGFGTLIDRPVEAKARGVQSND